MSEPGPGRDLDLLNWSISSAIQLPMSESAPGRDLERGLAVIRRRWPEMANDCLEEPVFVLAAGWRSGSTLLQRLLMPECFVWGEPFGHADLIDSLAEHLGCFTDDWPESHFFYQGAEPAALAEVFIANLYPSVEDLLAAHQYFFQVLFARPALRAGARRWGLKEVRLTVAHALYLKWLFPRARFLFLYRNPYEAYRSYAAWRADGWQWYKSWPDEPLTPRCFGSHWRKLVQSFLTEHAKVDGLVVRFEDLVQKQYAAIENYLGFPLSLAAARIKPPDGGPPPVTRIPEQDRTELEEEVGELAAMLGYAEKPFDGQLGSAAGFS